jgi:hypothetical protein
VRPAAVGRVEVHTGRNDLVDAVEDPFVKDNVRSRKLS